MESSLVKNQNLINFNIPLFVSVDENIFQEESKAEAGKKENIDEEMN